MTKKQILDYVMSSPWNTNPAVLSDMLDTFAESDNVDTSDATATVNDILQGKTAYVNDTKLTGTIVSKEAQTYTPTTTEQTINAGQYLSGVQTIAGDTNLIAVNIKSGVSIFGVSGTLEQGIDTSDANAVATDILSGKTAYVNGSLVTGSITSKEAQTYTPSTSAQTIAAGQYLSGAQTIAAVPTEEKSATPSATAQDITPTAGKFLSKVTVAGDANLLAENIKSGVTIFGVVGTYTGEAG